jgi:acyl-CoA thioesterase
MDRAMYLDLVKRTAEACPFYQLLRITVDSFGDGEAVLRMPYRDELLQPHRVVHGGAISSLADSATALALLGVLPPGSWFSTIEMKVNFVAPVDKGEMIARARIVHMGRTTAVADVDVTDGRGKLLAKSLQTYIVRRARKEEPHDDRAGDRG